MTLQEAFANQAKSCTSLGSPFMGRLMEMMSTRLDPDHGSVAARLFSWPGDVSSSGDSVPLRLAGGLHALKLRGNARLAAVYPPETVSDDALWQAVSDTIREEEAFFDAWLDSPPQTNEVRRSAALRPVGHWLAVRYGLPLELLELGASAGLNLNWDRYALGAEGRRFGPDDAAFTLIPDWTGPLPPDAEPRVQTRRGVDINPLSPEDDRLRLLAYLWPDQPERMARTEAALALPPAPVDRADAADWLEARQPQAPGICRLIYHTVAWQYFPETVQARAQTAIEAMGAAATDDTPLAWFGMEADGGRGAGLTLRLWPGDETRAAGRADFHGRWVEWALT